MILFGESYNDKQTKKKDDAKESKGTIELKLSRLRLPDQVQSRSRPEPIDLILAHRVLGGDLDYVAVRLAHLEGNDRRQITTDKRGHTHGLDLITSRDQRVIGLVGEPKGKNTLLLKVRLYSRVQRREREGKKSRQGREQRRLTVNTSERSGDDQRSTVEPRL